MAGGTAGDGNQGNTPPPNAPQSDSDQSSPMRSVTEGVTADHMNQILGRMEFDNKAAMEIVKLLGEMAKAKKKKPGSKAGKSAADKLNDEFDELAKQAKEYQEQVDKDLAAARARAADQNDQHRETSKTWRKAATAVRDYTEKFTASFGTLFAWMSVGSVVGNLDKLAEASNQASFGLMTFGGNANDALGALPDQMFNLGMSLSEMSDLYNKNSIAIRSYQNLTGEGFADLIVKMEDAGGVVGLTSKQLAEYGGSYLSRQKMVGQLDRMSAIERQSDMRRNIADMKKFSGMLGIGVAELNEQLNNMYKDDNFQLMMGSLSTDARAAVEGLLMQFGDSPAIQQALSDSMGSLSATQQAGETVHGLISMGMGDFVGPLIDMQRQALAGMTDEADESRNALAQMAVGMSKSRRESIQMLSKTANIDPAVKALANSLLAVRKIETTETKDTQKKLKIFRELMNKFGTLQDVLITGITEIILSMDMMKGIFDKNGDYVKGGEEKLKGVFNGIKEFMDGFLEGVSTILSTMKSIADGMLAVFGIADPDPATYGKLAAGLLALTLFASPIMWVVGLLAKLALNFRAIGTGIKSAYGVIKGAGGLLKGALRSFPLFAIIIGIFDFVTGFMESTRDSMFGKIMDGISNVGSEFLIMLFNIGAWILNLPAMLLDSLFGTNMFTSFIARGKDQFATAIKKLFKLLTDLVVNPIDTIKRLWNGDDEPAQKPTASVNNTNKEQGIVPGKGKPNTTPYRGRSRSLAPPINLPTMQAGKPANTEAGQENGFVEEAAKTQSIEQRMVNHNNKEIIASINNQTEISNRNANKLVEKVHRGNRNTSEIAGNI